MLTRSRQTQAYRKLGELHGRWKKANQLLAPCVDVLPQLLVVPVVLFIVGLLDNILVTSLPLSQPFAPLFIAGILCCLFALTVGLYTIWTVGHGCWYAESSPFQSTLSQCLAQVLVSTPTSMYTALRHCNNISLSFWRSVDWLSHQMHARHPSSYAVEPILPAQNLLPPELPLVVQCEIYTHTPSSNILVTRQEYEAFYLAIFETHEDVVLDEAVTALDDLRERWQKGGLSRPWPSPNIPHEYEAQALFHLLSSEASIRSNVAAASYIATSPSFRESNQWLSAGRCLIVW